MLPHRRFLLWRYREVSERVDRKVNGDFGGGSNYTTKFRYMGVGLKQEEVIIMDQKTYIEGIKTVRKEVYKGDRRLGAEEETIYKSIAGQLNWTVQHTRPDLAFRVSVTSQVGSDKISGDMRKLVKLVEKAKKNPLVVRMERLRGKVNIETYTDAFFGNVKDGR